MPYIPPADVDARPVVIDGAGTLGRQIAAVYAAGGSDVCIFDLSAEQREAARDYAEEHVAQTQQTLGLHPARRGQVEVLGNLQESVAGAWMVIEAVPESVDIKTELFGDLGRGSQVLPYTRLGEYTSRLCAGTLRVASWSWCRPVATLLERTGLPTKST
jgi:3-hydroxybutyryl-CoA dehydrogenase